MKLKEHEFYHSDSWDGNQEYYVQDMIDDLFFYLHKENNPELEKQVLPFIEDIVVAGKNIFAIDQFVRVVEDANIERLDQAFIDLKDEIGKYPDWDKDNYSHFNSRMLKQCKINKEAHGDIALNYGWLNDICDYLGVVEDIDMTPYFEKLAASGYYDTASELRDEMKTGANIFEIKKEKIDMVVAAYEEYLKNRKEEKPKTLGQKKRV